MIVVSPFCRKFSRCLSCVSVPNLKSSSRGLLKDKDKEGSLENTDVNQECKRGRRFAMSGTGVKVRQGHRLG